jgi:hypothetical protein
MDVQIVPPSVPLINNSINFKIFRENKALFDQIVVIF